MLDHVLVATVGRVVEFAIVRDALESRGGRGWVRGGEEVSERWDWDKSMNG